MRGAENPFISCVKTGNNKKNEEPRYNTGVFLCTIGKGIVDICCNSFYDGDIKSKYIDEVSITSFFEVKIYIIGR